MNFDTTWCMRVWFSHGALSPTWYFDVEENKHTTDRRSLRTTAQVWRLRNRKKKKKQGVSLEETIADVYQTS
jgi:hypothetical protein